jgi:hypothetical protein
MASATTWSELLHQIEAALASALGKVETWAEQPALRSSAQPEALRDFGEQIQHFERLAAQATAATQDADAALLAAREEMDAWRAKAGGAGRA